MDKQKAIKQVSEKQEVLESLGRLVKRGDTVYTILRHVSQSGMSRNIDMYVIIDNEPQYLNYLVAELLGYSRAKDGSIKITGCGMDMGYHLVYSLSVALFCPDKYDHDEAYSLEHRWL